MVVRDTTCDTDVLVTRDADAVIEADRRVETELVIVLEAGMDRDATALADWRVLVDRERLTDTVEHGVTLALVLLVDDKEQVDVALSVSDNEGVLEVTRDALSDADAQIVPLDECMRQGVGVGDAQVLLEGERLPLVDKDTVSDARSEPLEDSERVEVMLRVSDADGDSDARDALGARENDKDADVQVKIVRDAVEDEHALRDCERLTDAVAHTLTLALNELLEKRERVDTLLGDGVDTLVNDASAEKGSTGLDAVRGVEIEGVAVVIRDDVLLPDAHADTDTGSDEDLLTDEHLDSDLAGDAEAQDAEPQAVATGERVRLPLLELQPDARGDGASVKTPERLEEPTREGVLVTDGECDVEFCALGDINADGPTVIALDLLADITRERVCATEDEREADTVAEKHALLVRPRLTVAVVHTEALLLDEPLVERVSNGGREREKDAEAVPTSDGTTVTMLDPLKDCACDDFAVADRERDTVIVAVGHALVDKVRLGNPDEQGVTLVLGLSVGVSERVDVTLSVSDSVGVFEKAGDLLGDVDTQSVALGVDAAHGVGVSEAQLLLEGERLLLVV